MLKDTVAFADHIENIMRTQLGVDKDEQVDEEEEIVDEEPPEDDEDEEEEEEEEEDEEDPADVASDDADKEKDEL